jgi:DNA-binding response OmpR family regulator
MLILTLFMMAKLPLGISTRLTNQNVPCPDLVLLDMNLPKKSGNEVLQYLRATERCRYAAVLIVSSSDTPRDRASVETFTVAGYFKKPSNYAEFMKLGSVVRDLLEPGTRPE